MCQAWLCVLYMDNVGLFHNPGQKLLVFSFCMCLGQVSIILLWEYHLSSPASGYKTNSKAEEIAVFSLAEGILEEPGQKICRTEIQAISRLFLLTIFPASASTVTTKP